MNFRKMALAMSTALLMPVVVEAEEQVEKDPTVQTIMDGINCEAFEEVEEDRAWHDWFTALFESEDPMTTMKFVEVLKCGEFERVEIEHLKNSIRLILKREDLDDINHVFSVNIGDDLQKHMLKNGIEASSKNGLEYATYLMILLMLVVMLSTWGMNGGFNRRGKAPERKSPNVSLSQVGGLRNAKRDLEEMIEAIRNRKEILEAGGTIPKGTLFSGAPGTGKTMSARAIATEAGVPFIQISGTEVISKWAGATAESIRKTFKRARDIAKKKGFCILFIDEIDAIGTRRSETRQALGKEQNAIVNQLLVDMDGFEVESNLMVLAATNNPGHLDPALVRPGRFDNEIHFTSPDQEGRLEILEIMTGNLELADDVRLQGISSVMVGKSGAEIANVVKRAKNMAIKRGKPVVVTQEDFSTAVDRELLGLKSDIELSEDEARRTAIHEAGHTLLALADPDVGVERVTIVPRGRSLGVTMTPPHVERNLHSRTVMRNHVKMLLAGRLAEVLEFGEGSDGAMDDLDRATKMAREAVTKLGFVGSDSEGLSDVRSYDGDNKVGMKMREMVDVAINLFLNNCRDEVSEYLSEHRVVLVALAERLLEKKTIHRDEILEIVNCFD